MANERFIALHNSSLGEELIALRNGETDPDQAWFRFKAILAHQVEGFPDRFVEILDPIERIFKKRMQVVFSHVGSREAGDLVINELSRFEGGQRALMEEILPMITYTFNTSDRESNFRMKGSRRHH